MKLLIFITLGLLLVVFISGCVQEGGGAPVDVPADIENNCIGFLIGNPDEEAGTVADIGGGWARPHPGPFAWQWIEPVKGNFIFEGTDYWVRKIQENEIAILGTIWPYSDWDQAKCHSDECEVTPEHIFYPKPEPRRPPMGIPISRCVPCNFDDYKNFVSRMVERYDGDGTNDMPGLKIPIKYWEVLNEPELAEVPITFFMGTQEEYVEILKASHEAIKSACPDCKVVQGGAQHSMPENLAWWGRVFDLGGSDYFDIANIHYINEGDLNTLNVEDFKGLLEGKGISKPIWVTEAQYKSEDQIEASVEGSLKAGASKIFFTQFEVGRFGVPSPGEYSSVYDRMPGKCS